MPTVLKSANDLNLQLGDEVTFDSKAGNTYYLRLVNNDSRFGENINIYMVNHIQYFSSEALQKDFVNILPNFNYDKITSALEEDYTKKFSNIIPFISPYTVKDIVLGNLNSLVTSERLINAPSAVCITKIAPTTTLFNYHRQISRYEDGNRVGFSNSNDNIIYYLSSTPENGFYHIDATIGSWWDSNPGMIQGHPVFVIAIKKDLKVFNDRKKLITDDKITTSLEDSSWGVVTEMKDLTFDFSSTYAYSDNITIRLDINGKTFEKSFTWGQSQVINKREYSHLCKFGNNVIKAKAYHSSLSIDNPTSSKEITFTCSFEASSIVTLPSNSSIKDITSKLSEIKEYQGYLLARLGGTLTNNKIPLPPEPSLNSLTGVLDKCIISGGVEEILMPYSGESKLYWYYGGTSTSVNYLVIPYFFRDIAPKNPKLILVKREFDSSNLDTGIFSGYITRADGFLSSFISSYPTSSAATGKFSPDYIFNLTSCSGYSSSTEGFNFTAYLTLKGGYVGKRGDDLFLPCDNTATSTYKAKALIIY